MGSDMILKFLVFVGAVSVGFILGGMVGGDGGLKVGASIGAVVGAFIVGKLE